MDLQQLKHCLQAAGVPEREYLLVGLDPPRAVQEGACIIRPNQRDWEVLVWRPVRLEPSVTFLAEDEACEYVLDTLTADRAGRGGRVLTLSSAPAAPDRTAAPVVSLTDSPVTTEHTTGPGRRRPRPAPPVPEVIATRAGPGPQEASLRI